MEFASKMTGTKRKSKTLTRMCVFVELRDRERICVASLRDLMAPVHTLPEELLAEIFDLAIPSDSHVEAPHDMFRISLVCSKSEDVFRISQIDLRIAASSDGEVYADGLKTWLLRSAPLAIPVSLVLHDNGVNHCMGFTPLALVRQLAEVRFDSMEELQVESLTIERGGPTSISFTEVPRLQKLRMDLGSNGLRSDGLLVLVPWAQLTDLTIRTPFDNVAFDILAQCANLIHADLTASGGGVAEARIIPFDYLLSLSLRFFGAREHLPLSFDCFSAPALEKLNVRFGLRWPQARFAAFQLRTPNITYLDLKYSPITSDDLRAAIRHAPSLTHLELTSCESCCDDVLLDALATKPAEAPSLPICTICSLIRLATTLQKMLWYAPKTLETYWQTILFNTLRKRSATSRLICLLVRGANHLHTLLFNDPGDNFTEDNMASMIASRWWIDGELASHPIPPVVARWTRFAFRCPNTRPFLMCYAQDADIETESFPVKRRSHAPGGCKIAGD
ncbi:hypothetical protein C8R45DRAFT_924411 [Mycena sanguinolenta]|nr:hypothetical protein C8R45DRAFT_924411 [Mycena sanguinolenta]